MIDIAEDIQGSTLRKNIFPESKKQELNKNKQKILDPGSNIELLRKFLILFSKSYLLAIPEISLEFRFPWVSSFAKNRLCSMDSRIVRKLRN